jgi:hypothetical protein
MNQNDSFAKSIRDGYPNDHLYSKILAQPKCHPTFRMHNKLLWICNINKEWVVCLLHGRIDDQSIHGLVIDQAHTVLGHFGAQHMQYTHRGKMQYAHRKYQKASIKI